MRGIPAGREQVPFDHFESFSSPYTNKSVFRFKLDILLIQVVGVLINEMKLNNRYYYMILLFSVQFA